MLIPFNLGLVPYEREFRTPVSLFDLSSSRNIKSEECDWHKPDPFPVEDAISTREISGAQNACRSGRQPQDEVEMQLEPPGEIAVYQVVDRPGSLILTVLSE